MTQKSLSSETCLGYLSALQVHAFCRRRGIALATTRHRHFPSKAASRDQANDLTIRTCDPYLPAGIPMPLHCVSSSASTPRSAEFRKPHLCRLPLSGNALQRWNESILLSSPSLAFIQEASLRSFVDTLVLGFELCGTYQQQTLATSTVYGTQPLTSVRKIRGFLERNSRLFGAQRARAAASYLVDGSASPRETQAALLLGLPAFYGGYGLGMPSMNYEISCTPQATAISGRRTLRCDLFWPEASIAVEYQSREFHSGDLCRIRDSRRTNALQAMGIAVVGLTNNELESVEATDVIVETVRKAQGVRFRTAVGNYHARKLRLRRQLGLPLYPMRPLRLDHTKNRASAGRISQECRRSSFRNSAARQPNGAPPANTNAVGKGRRRPSPPAPAQRETPAAIQPTSFRRGPSEGIAAYRPR